MSYQLKVLKDHPIALWPLDESSGSIAYDISPCGNNSEYIGSISSSRFPLVSGGQRGTKIDSSNYISYSVDNDYQGSTVGGSFANQGYSDNDFSLECWYYPLDMDSDFQLIFGDSNQCSIQANDTNVEFMVHDEIIQYTLPTQRKNTHIVATYTPGRISLYVNGKIASSKEIPDFKFLNESLDIKSIANGSSSFLIDAPAVYRYALSEASVLQHYLANTSLDSIHVVGPDGGSLLEFYDDNTSTKFKYNYPANRPWQDMVADGLMYDQESNSLKLRYSEAGGPLEVEVVDFISIPIDLYNIASINKIQWKSSNGVSVYISYDGDNYQECLNGFANQVSQNEFYIKIVFSSSNISEFLPSITSLSIKFMSSDLTMYSKNTSMYADNFVDSAILEKAATLDMDYFNGLLCSTGGTFDITEGFTVNAIEFLYTPYELSGTFSDSFYPGDLYINGQAVSETLMASIFNINEIHHVAVNVNALSDLSDFNSSGNSALFQDICLYADQLTSSQILNHYQLYTGRPSISVEESSFSVTENTFKAYNNNWTVIQNS